MEFDVKQGMGMLERTPAVLRTQLSGLGAEWTDATEGPDTWSPYVIVGHLIHGERTDWIPRAEIILAQGANRRFTPYDRFAQFHESEGKTLVMLLDEFARLRADNLVTLEQWQLTDTQLALEGEHPEFGAVSLRQLLATWVAHDLGHIAQCARVMARAVSRSHWTVARLPDRDGPVSVPRHGAGAGPGGIVKVLRDDRHKGEDQ